MLPSPPRFNGRPRFNAARGDGPPRFDGPGFNRFTVPRFDGRPRFDASPLMFRRAGPVVQLEPPFRGGLAMGPRFQGSVPGGGSYPPWYGNDEIETEEEMQSEDFERTGSGVPSLLDIDHPPRLDSAQAVNEENVAEQCLDDSSQQEHAVDATISESKATDNTDSSGNSEKRVRKSRWSNVPTGENSSTEPVDSNTETSDSTANASAVTTDTV